MRRAFLTFVAMNFDVVWMAVRRSVKSPVAAGPRRSWSLRICLDTTNSAMPWISSYYITDAYMRVHVPGEGDDVSAWNLFSHLSVTNSLSLKLIE